MGFFKLIGGFRGVAMFAVGIMIALIAFETYDRIYDDPAVFKDGQDEVTLRVTTETNRKLREAENEARQAQIEMEKIVRKVKSEAAQRRSEIEKLNDEFNARPDAGDPTGVDGRFLR